MLRKLPPLLVFLLFPVFSPAQTLGFSLADGRSRVQIPVEIYNNLIVIPVVLNGQLPLKFILDTGVRTAILTEKTFSDILNLSYSRRYSIAGPGGQKIVEAYVTNNVSLDLPGVHGEGHAMLVLEEDYLELRNYLGTDVHGILGYELFSRFIVKIDYERKQLTLMLPGRFRPGRRYIQMPITIQDTKPYFQTHLEMNDSCRVKVKLLIDSGASHGLILEPDSNDSLKTPPRHIKSIIGRGLGGVITGQIGRIKSLTLGKYLIEDAIVNFPDPNSYMDTLKTSRTVPRNGALGGEILSRFSVIFNFPGERVYIKKNSSFRKKFYYNMSGITLKAKGARLKSFEVSDVRENSSAQKAGLKIGDHIMTINGLPAAELDLNSVNGFFNTRPGKKIVVEVEREGKKMKMQFYLENQI